MSAARFVPVRAPAGVGIGALPGLATANSQGVISGLLLGKSFGITLMSFIAVVAGDYDMDTMDFGATEASTKV